MYSETFTISWLISPSLINAISLGFKISDLSLFSTATFPLTNTTDSIISSVYDDTLNEVYFFDSLKEYDENDNAPGNRTLSSDYFLDMWDNKIPTFNHLYFTITKR